jgi:hypothetical protein
MYADLRVMEGRLKQLLAEMAADKAAAEAAGDTQRIDDAATVEGEALLLVLWQVRPSYCGR